MSGFNWAGLLPDDLSLWLAISLLVLSAFTSFISAALGMGGGMVLLAVIATILPAHALIPVHGVVQIGSNISRAAVMARHIHLPALLPMTLGGLMGVMTGGLIATRLPDWLLYLAVGIFVLWSARNKKNFSLGQATIFLGGIISGFLTMFIGGTGPFVAAVIKSLNLDRMTHVGTQAGCMVFQHGLKIAVFGVLGFNYLPYLPLVFGMISFGILGTLVGRRVLYGLGDSRFRVALNILLILLGLRLLWMSGSAVFQGS
ncbi:MAG: sulfite exporter TauE/SafE family protein [Alphaproteobacteria bacterium]